MVAQTDIQKIDMSEFQAHLQEYILKSAPVAITRQGKIVGYFLPICRRPEKTKIESLKRAALKLDKLLASHGVSEEELLDEFRAIRKAAIS
jgi:hypothetical protein